MFLFESKAFHALSPIVTFPQLPKRPPQNSLVLKIQCFQRRRRKKLMFTFAFSLTLLSSIIQSKLPTCHIENSDARLYLPDFPANGLWSREIEGEQIGWHPCGMNLFNMNRSYLRIGDCTKAQLCKIRLAHEFRVANPIARSDFTLEIVQRTSLLWTISYTDYDLQAIQAKVNLHCSSKHQYIILNRKDAALTIYHRCFCGDLCAISEAFDKVHLWMMFGGIVTLVFFTLSMFVCCWYDKQRRAFCHGQLLEIGCSSSDASTQPQWEFPKASRPLRIYNDFFVSNDEIRLIKCLKRNNFSETWKVEIRYRSKIAKFFTCFYDELMSDSCSDRLTSIADQVHKISKLAIHPNLMPLDGICTTASFISIISSECDGISLLEFVQARIGTIRSKLKLIWIIEMLDALHFLHRNKLYHTHLKPINIFIERSSERLKLTTAYIEHYLNQNISEMVQCETNNDCLRWYSPELIGQKVIDWSKVDVYASALIAWFLINEAFPLAEIEDDADLLDVVEKEGHLAYFMNDAHFLPLSLTTVIGECLRFDPDERLTILSARQRFKEVLKRFNRGETMLNTRSQATKYENTTTFYPVNTSSNDHLLSF